MDILLRLKAGLDSLLWDNLDRRLLLSILRLASILLDGAILLSLGTHIFRPVRPFQQWLLAMAGCALALATPLDGLSRTPRALLLWVLLAAVLALLFLPRMLSNGLAASVPARTRIERALYCFIAATFVLQVIALWLG